MTEQIALRRALNLPLLTLYGLGTTVGAGIYVLVGEVAGLAGYMAPLAFFLAAILAGISALSFAELSVRYPLSAGEAIYVREGFRSDRLAVMVGFLVIAAGVVSSAAIVNGFVGYFQRLVDIPSWAALVLIVAALGLIAVWGIAESVTVASVVTVVEIGGLVMILMVTGDQISALPEIVAQTRESLSWHQATGVLAGGVLAFYAFIGFEDMVNVAEEVKDVRRVMPRAIVLTVLLTTVLYVSVSLAAVLTISPADLADSKAPIADIYQAATGKPATLITLISIVAVLNGALIQIVMASRVLYGLANKGLLPRAFAAIDPRTRTPMVATAAISGLILILALSVTLLSLAQTTSLITLTIFSLVNLALVRIKLRLPGPDKDAFIPIWVPIGGFIVSAAFALYQAGSFIGN